MCGTETNQSPAGVKHNGKQQHSGDLVINLDHGDPTVFEKYWRNIGEKCTIEMKGNQCLSYFSDPKSLCWYMEPKLEKAIKNLHRVVGNAVIDDYCVVVGTGSSQLIQAALFALSRDEPEPLNVVCSAPYYSAYVEVTDFVRSGLYKWAGDANTFEKDGPYIEFVTTPNNPDGKTREPVVNRPGGKLVYDLAYYWPQYTPITGAANHDIMLFTASKCTGHAGSRIGWALVKDREVAKKMVKFIEVNTIGVSKEAQLRTTRILEVICEGCCSKDAKGENFFEHGRRVMEERWERLRNVVKRTQMFTLPKYPLQSCIFSGGFSETNPAFAWLRSEECIEDCEMFFRGHNILTRSGRRFGTDPRYVRASMVCTDKEFDIFLKRIAGFRILIAVSSLNTDDERNL